MCVTDGEQSDSASEPEVGIELIGQWETEFLQERLQELLRAAADGDQGDSETQVQPIGTLHQSKQFPGRPPTVCDVHRAASA